ncbi:hypothetical protein DNTS_009670 [Danionella cerebrum]|uniref:Secretory carrier-associated membrane protein n=1 Tax=Danionella cerebrum TaxID=2873325 RepID=A0A553NI65_9TELE|nr:hypothetical protein DNTS_009670 [Danionella translucida]
MSKYTSFPDSSDDHNPFQDPSVMQHSSNTGYATLDLYNPFDNNPAAPPPPYEATPPAAPPAQTPPSRTTPTEGKNYGSYGTQNNWPPLPSFCPVGPCFYQDINVEISQSFQRTVTTLYYYWILAMFCVDPNNGVGFGLAILWFLLFTPCSFVCWYRPVYKAFRSDSSFNFFAFFFVFFAQLVLYIIMTIGIPGWGFSGWIVSLAALAKNKAVGVIMMMNAVLFTAQAAMGVVLLKRVHSMYRQTDASFEKAQAEFATGVLSNQAVRQAAANATVSAAQGAFTAPR